ncbi:hypothetical protein ES702_02247 [subsurface metagenome]
MKKRTGESIKDLILGEDLDKKKPTSKTVRQQPSKTAKQDIDKTLKRYTIKKATYYIKEPSLIKELKLLSVEKERDLSDLVTEAIRDLIRKYKQ